MTDLEIIKQIKKEVNITYYSLNQNDQVIGLDLHYCIIKNLNSIISLLKALTNLTGLNLSRSVGLRLCENVKKSECSPFMGCCEMHKGIS